MTMIATTLNYNIPFIVSDVLFTSEDGRDGIQTTNKQLPDILFLKDPDWQTSLLEAKALYPSAKCLCRDRRCRERAGAFHK